MHVCTRVCVCVADGSVSQGAGAVPQRSTDLAGAPGGGSQTGGKPQGGGLPGEQGLTYTLKGNDSLLLTLYTSKQCVCHAGL